MENFRDIKFFSPYEMWGKKNAWGQPERMDTHFLRLLDTVRSLHKHPYIIHCGYELGGHSKLSYHKAGRAADGHTLKVHPLTGLLEMQQILLDMQANDRVGLGYYPHWANPGWHLDDRGWAGPGRPKLPGIFWVRLDRTQLGYKPGYYYNENADRIVELLKRHKQESGVK